MKSFGLNAPEGMRQLEEAVERVEQMLKEEPERFMEVWVVKVNVIRMDATAETPLRFVAR